MNMKMVLTATALAVAFGATGAKADVTRHLDMTFQSGATFSGNVTFLNDYSAITGVSGILTGYQFGTNTYVGGGATDSINWVWANGANFSSGTDNYSDFLMDGPGSGYNSTGGYSNWIELAYNYSSAPALSFTSGVSYGGTDNYVDYNDPMVKGSFSAGVPEPATWAMMIFGVSLLGLALRGQRRSATLAAA